MNTIKSIGRVVLEGMNAIAGLVAMVLYGALIVAMCIGIVYACYLTFSNGGRYPGFGILGALIAVLWALARHDCFKSAATRATVSQKF